MDYRFTDTHTHTHQAAVWNSALITIINNDFQSSTTPSLLPRGFNSLHCRVNIKLTHIVWHCFPVQLWFGQSQVLCRPSSSVTRCFCVHRNIPNIACRIFHTYFLLHDTEHNPANNSCQHGTLCQCNIPKPKLHPHRSAQDIPHSAKTLLKPRACAVKRQCVSKHVVKTLVVRNS